MNQIKAVTQAPAQPKTSLVSKMADKFAVDPAKFMVTLKSTAFKQRNGEAPSDEQMMALMVVSDQYGLNPFTKEIYAFPDKQNGIIPVVGVDGWSRIINQHPAFDGLEFRQSDNMVEMAGAKVKAPEWMEVVIYRKDRKNPVVIREYLDEVYRAPFQGKGRNGSYSVEGPWQTHPKRFLRHKTLIQGARVGLGYTGIYDKDEAERIVDAQLVSEQDGQGNVEPVNAQASAPLSEGKKAEISRLVETLAARAVQQGAWSAAVEYLEGRYSGSELTYGKQLLETAEMDSLKADSSIIEGTPETAAEAPQSGAEEQPPMADPAYAQAQEQDQDDFNF